MQTLTEIKAILASAGRRPGKGLGQNFLVDGNIMRKLLDLADVAAGATVLEVGPGTGSLTEELLDRGASVVAVELDRGLFELLRRRFGDREGLRLIRADALAGKHAIAPGVVAALGPEAQLVANLPYSIATPLVAQCLIDSWRSAVCDDGARCAFDRLTFTVQKEVADRISAGPGGKAYGPVSVLASVLGTITRGTVVPASAFWPRPKVASAILRIDFDEARAARLDSVDALGQLLSAAFGQRRKQIGRLTRDKNAPFRPGAFADAMARAGVAPTLRPEQVPPDAFRLMANALATG
jgi:16S rRNA (adenine1518-N6/adenine1519-N6)-dimethyltransferase